MGQFTRHTSALPQQCEALDQNSQQISGGDFFFFFLNELVIFSFKLRPYICASCLLADLSNDLL